MTWMLYLYPPRWRKRYGKEFTALVGAHPFSFVTLLDIVGSAIDAWTSPQSHLAAPEAAHQEGDTIMLAKQMRLRCEGFGETPTIGDSVKGAAVILVGSLVSVLVAGWLRRQPVDPVYPEMLMSSGWLIAFVLAMPFTALKGWPVRTQVVFLGALLMALLAVIAGGTWINR